MKHPIAYYYPTWAINARGAPDHIIISTLDFQMVGKGQKGDA